MFFRQRHGWTLYIVSEIKGNIAAECSKMWGNGVRNFSSLSSHAAYASPFTQVPCNRNVFPTFPALWNTQWKFHCLSFAGKTRADHLRSTLCNKWGWRTCYHVDTCDIRQTYFNEFPYETKIGWVEQYFKADRILSSDLYVVHVTSYQAKPLSVLPERKERKSNGKSIREKAIFCMKIASFMK